MLDWNEIRISQQIGGWTVEMYWREDEIQGGPLKLVVRPSEKENVPPGGISSTVLRKVDFRAGAADAREKLTEENRAYAEEDRAYAEKINKRPLQVAMPLLKSLLETGGITDIYLVLLAAEYVGRVDHGEAKPVDHIAEELGKSPGTVKNHLWQARDRGLLMGGSAGRKGGFVPPEAAQIAIEFLDEMNNALGQSDKDRT